MENISPAIFWLLSIFILIVLWLYFFIHSYRHNDIFPWGLGIVIVGILVSGVGYKFYDNQLVVFSINFPFVVSLIGILFNINNIQNQFYVRNIREFILFAGIGLISGVVLTSFHITILAMKNFPIPSNYTTFAFLAIGVQGGIAEEILFRGYFLSSLIKHKFNYIFAIVLQASIFAFLHVLLYPDSWTTIFILFLNGTIAGYLTWKSNNLVPAFVLHIIFNLTAVIWWLAIV